MSYYQRYKEYRRMRRFENTPMANFPSVGTPLPNARDMGIFSPSASSNSKSMRRIYKKPLWRDN